MIPSRPLRLAIALWVVVGIAVSVRTLLRPHDHTVFPILAGSADHFWHDQPLYDDYKPLDYFRYPPCFAVLFTPLGMLGPRLGGILWAWLSLAVYGAGLWAFARRVLPVRWTDVRLAVYLALGLFGGLRGLWNGQSNALAVGLLLLGVAALVERRLWSAAFLLAGPTTVKLTPLAPVLLLCALWPRGLTPRFALALAVLAAVPFLARPPAVVVGHYRAFATHLRASEHERWPGFRDAWTVWQVLRHYGTDETGIPWLKEPLDSPAYRVVQMSTAFVALLWCLWLRGVPCFRTRKHALEYQSMAPMPERRLVTLTLAAGLAWLMLFGPAVEHATYVLLAPVLCWAVLEPEGRRVRIGTAFALVMVLGWGGLTRPLLDALPLLLVALPLGTAVFVLWLAGCERDDLACVYVSRGRARNVNTMPTLSGLAPPETVSAPHPNSVSVL